MSKTFALPLLLSIFLLVPSFDTALKYGGSIGVLAYFVLGTAAVFIGYRFLLPLFLSSVSARTADYFAIATFVGLAAIALYTYPIVNSRPGLVGTDADDALITAATEFLNGRYPYRLTTYLGNLISPMPGAVLLAMPFVVVGLIQLQNVVWLAAFYLVYRRFEGSSTAALGLVWVILVMSPTVMQNVVTGGDYTANTIYVVVAMWLLAPSLADPNSPAWKRILPAILLGIGLSSRSTFILLMPLFLSLLIQIADWKQGIKYLSISGVVFLAVTLPFWVYDPAAFAPLHVQSDKLKAVEDTLPYASVLIPGTTLLLSIVLSLQTMRSDLFRFFLNCAIVQIYVLLLTAVVYSVKQGQLDLYIGQAGYGIFTLFFGATAIWMKMNRKARNSGQNHELVT